VGFCLGIDVGGTGALVALSHRHKVLLMERMPMRKLDLTHAEVDACRLRELIDSLASEGAVGPDLVVIEKVGPVPGSSRKGAFTFGRHYQALLTLCELEGWPHELVQAQAWKGEVLAGTDRSKQAAMDWATRTFGLDPPLTHDGLGDAFCMAELAWRRCYGSQGRQERKRRGVKDESE